MATPITEEQRKKYAEDHEKATLIKESLKIVDELAEFDTDELAIDDDVLSDLFDLIEKAKKIIRNRLWRLR
jgi:hypothetical protein